MSVPCPVDRGRSETAVGTPDRVASERLQSEGAYSFCVRRVTLREATRHALHVTSLDGLVMRRREARGLDNGHLRGGDRRQVFSRVYELGVWLNGKSEGALSGLGSELQATESLRQQLPLTLRELGADSLLDVGCGDFTWMRSVDLGGVRYIGVDIVESLLAENARSFGSDGRQFVCLDAVTDSLPRADAVLCREILFHLSFDDGLQLVRNIKASGATHLLATTDSITSFNADITTGDYRVLNLEKRPYKFPRPATWLPDDAVMPGRRIGAWLVSDL
jgi:Methyltransferase domain